MSADLLPGGACCGCPDGTTEIESSLATVGRRGDSFVNGRKVNDAELAVLVENGGSPGDYQYWFQSFDVELAYPVYSTETSGRQGTWHLRGVTTYIGPGVVESEDEVDYVYIDTSDSMPSDPLYVDLLDLRLDESAVSVEGEIVPDDLRQVAIASAGEQEWVRLSDIPNTELKGYMSGVFVDENVGSSMAIQVLYLPGFYFKDLEENQAIVTDRDDGAVVFPLSVFIEIYDVELDEAELDTTESFTCVWNESQRAFLPDGSDPADPDGPGWRELPFDGDGEEYYSAQVGDAWGELWPLFRIEA